MKDILKAQRAELTEVHIYTKLASRIKNKQNANILLDIAQDEQKHADYWYTITKKDLKPNQFKVFLYVAIARLFGLTFGVRLMEMGENRAQISYESIIERYPNARFIINEENEHEQALIEMLKERKLNYIGSVVLGLNDALVELTGALAGLTFALQNTRLIALAGLITGIAASFSMAASEYLSNKAEGNTKSALTSAIYTGIAYIFTVAFLVIPYFTISNMYAALASTLGIAILIIFVFNFYISVAKQYNFKKRFLEMTLISMGVAGVSFLIGFIVRKTLGIEV
jgi:VIT1/CCC1 family predicted Fe2+/Mn2+ transporter